MSNLIPLVCNPRNTGRIRKKGKFTQNYICTRRSFISFLEFLIFIIHSICIIRTSLSIAFAYWIAKIGKIFNIISTMCDDDYKGLNNDISQRTSRTRDSFAKRSNEKSVLIALSAQSELGTISYPPLWLERKKLSRKVICTTTILRAAEMRSLPLRVDSTNVSIWNAGRRLRWNCANICIKFGESSGYFDHLADTFNHCPSTNF